MDLTKKQMNKLNNGREYRAMVLEAGEGDEKIVEGYATTFNQPYELFSGDGFTVREQVDAHAFDDCDMSDVIMQYDHEGRVFARNKNGTLNLELDGNGLKIRADLGGTDIGRQLYEEIKGGYTDKMSFGFIVADDRQEVTTDHETGHEDVLRTITKIRKLFDVSAVSLPANDMTSISARKYSDGVIEEAKKQKAERSRKKLALMLELNK